MEDYADSSQVLSVAPMQSKQRHSMPSEHPRVSGSLEARGSHCPSDSSFGRSQPGKA